MAQRVIGGNLDQNDPNAVGVLDPHFGQSPGLGGRLTENTSSGRGQPVVLSVDIPNLEPDDHRAPGRTGRTPGDLEQSRAEKEHHSGICGRAKFPVDR